MKNNDELTYLAIPYSGMENISFKMSCVVAARLMEDGELIFSPIAHSHPIHYYMFAVAHDHGFWMEYNTRMMKKCQKLYIVTRDGWETSVGVQFEIQWFLDHELPIYLLIIDYNTGALTKKRFYKYNGNVMETEQLNLFNRPLPLDK